MLEILFMIVSAALMVSAIIIGVLWGKLRERSLTNGRYTLKGERCCVVSGLYAVHIVATADGVVCDIYQDNRESDPPLGGCWADDGQLVDDGEDDDDFSIDDLPSAGPLKQYLTISCREGDETRELDCIPLRIIHDSAEILDGPYNYLPHARRNHKVAELDEVYQNIVSALGRLMAGERQVDIDGYVFEISELPEGSVKNGKVT